MALIRCEVCGAGPGAEWADVGEMVFCCKTCAPFYGHYSKLAGRLAELGRELDVLRDAARAVMAEGGRDVLDGDDTAVVPADAIRRLAKCLDYKGDPDKYMVGYVMELRLISEVSRLFRKGHCQGNSTLDQLERVRETITKLLKFKYPEAKSVERLTSEAVAQLLAKEVR
jgi:hypothetical protein